METLECIKTRRSVRKYLDKPVEWDKITKILDAGRLAPSAGNLQNWKFIVTRKDNIKTKLAEASFQQKWMEEADVHITIVAEPEKASQFYGTRGERLYTIQNCAAAIQNMLLAANDQGLGSCWVGAFDEDLVRRALKLPEHVSPQAIITIGYADEKAEMPIKKRIEHVVYIDKWWGRGITERTRGYTSDMIKETIKNTKKALGRVKKRLLKY